MAAQHPTSLRKPCCTSALKQSSQYVPKGATITLNDLIIYESPFNDPSRVVICAYDIFGFHENTKEVCDRLGEQGDFRVVMPDFYRGDYWRVDRLTQLMYSWFNYTCGLDEAKKDILKVIAYYREKGATSFAIFGFCWGGKISVKCGIELEDIKCIGLVHPSGVKAEEASYVNCPVVVLPSSEEHDFIPFKNRIIGRLGENACIHCRFDNMKHGFCAARGDFTDPATKLAVTHVLEHLVEFFNDHMPKNVKVTEENIPDVPGDHAKTMSVRVVSSQYHLPTHKK